MSRRAAKTSTTPSSAEGWSTLTPLAVANVDHPSESAGVVDVLHADRALVELARTQHGVVAARQLLVLGLGRRGIEHRISEGRLRPIHRGVYLAGAVPAALSYEMAAVLAAGEDAVLSHHAAAALWGLTSSRPPILDVTVPGSARRTRPGLRVHRARRLDDRDVTTRHGIPVTTAARTLLDIAASMPERDLARAAEQAEVLRLADRRSLERLVTRSPGHRGVAALRAYLGRGETPQLTRSEAEQRMRDLIRAARLPTPRTNVRVGRHEVDLLWATERLVVEVDGFAFHNTRAAFERDRARDAELQAAGYRVIRVTWRQLVDEPEAVIARIAATLATRVSRSQLGGGR